MTKQKCHITEFQGKRLIMKATGEEWRLTGRMRRKANHWFLQAGLPNYYLLMDDKTYYCYHRPEMFKGFKEIYNILEAKGIGR